ncbi:branched-chain amino acid aminotransferase [Helcobacillus massiliensis]|uniref:branched-chain amino acid aminotransferase n=1 Tax=Helcobacillus massiliensis TaxID=521392 RepID=UPI0025547F79|nr:branched-chain amino acid aminotransferase [Helcobacillus massiliensis]MDK7742107.1 branched-chain amino acid aminotransferase [Helcobacillus massiliensis]WOO93662.1 branched-chain amino acid aminotransferase [Helcobacillus massiliensis]
MTYTPPTAPRRTSDERRAEILAAPGFGNHFTDYMAHQRWTVGEGWSSGEVLPYGPLNIEPASAVLHYAQEIFEGLKAFRHADGSVWTFRPDMNALRFQRSAERLALPPLSTADFIASLEAVVQADEPWVPGGGEKSLYLRPFMFANENFLGVRASHTVDFYTIASPAGDYFPRGVQPLTVWISPDYARAGRGGTGFAKCGGNYASSLEGKNSAVGQGADEVMFLDSETHTFIDELSGMNVFVLHSDGRLVTPQLTGSILPGVTRDSILELAPDHGLTPVEERIDIHRLAEDIASGEVLEMFAAGTAAVINPIGKLASEQGEWTIGDGGSGETTMALRRILTDLQYGRIADDRGWMHRLV